LRVLVACEYSGIVREAFAARGHDAWSCDILPTEIPGKHYQGDVTQLMRMDWDLLIAHPPCTYLTNSGVRWLYNKDGSENEDRWKLMVEGVEFFRMFLYADHIPKRAVENPIMHGHAARRVGRKQDQIIQPWMFGHGETKATGLWLEGLPKLEPTNIVEGREQRIWKLPPTADRAKLRSKTYEGIAQAMAQQWG
jgi:hypothetical protein